MHLIQKVERLEFNNLDATHIKEQKSISMSEANLQDLTTIYWGYNLTYSIHKEIIAIQNYEVFFFLFITN
jgi:hypothetical protein